MGINTQLKQASDRNATTTETFGNVVQADFAQKSGESDSAEQHKAFNTAMANTWLEWQCKMVSGIITGVVYQPESIHPNSEIAIWPNSQPSDVVLVASATQALKKDSGVKFSKIAYGAQRKRLCDVVACPIYKDGEVIAVVAVQISVRSEPQQHAVLQLLRWGGVWAESLVDNAPKLSRKMSDFPLKLISSVLHQASFAKAAHETVNLFADFLHCHRVSIGVCHGMQVRLQAISNEQDFDHRSQHSRATEAAMEEAVDQICVITHPNTKEDNQEVCRRAHFELSNLHASQTNCTLPLLGESGIFGAITFERSQSDPFDDTTVSLLMSLLKHVAPILDLKKRDEQFLRQKGMKVTINKASQIFGNSHRKSLLIILLLLSPLFLASMVDGKYEVSAPSRIESDVVQHLVAPHDGYIKTVNARAGDAVTKGQVITKLEDNTLKLNLQKMRGESNQLDKEYQQALVMGERAKLGILKAKIEQVNAEIKLISDEILQTQLTSPFDGVIVSGDLNQSLGSPVTVGQVLFKVAPLDKYRVVIEVDEHEIDRFSIGSKGHLIIAAMPTTTFAIVVNQIVPLAISGEANNHFQVEAILDEPSSLLRPGMRGVAKIELGERNLLWIWTHSLLDRIRLWAWSVGL